MSTRSASRSAASQLTRFAAIGIAGTAAYIALYLLLRQGSGAQFSGAAARVLVAVPTTWLNGRWIFGRRVGALRLVLGSGATVAVGAAITSGMLAAEHALLPGGGRVAEVTALGAATVVATVARFLMLRSGVFGRPGAAVRA